MHLQRRGQIIGQPKPDMSIDLKRKGVKNQIAGRKKGKTVWLLTWRLEKRQESNCCCYLSDNRADLILNGLNRLLSGSAVEIHENQVNM